MGWLPIKSVEDRFFLHDSPYVSQGGSFDLEMDIRGWFDEKARYFPESVKEWVLGKEMKGLKTRMIVAKSLERVWESKMATWSEEERSRFELVVVC